MKELTSSFLSTIGKILAVCLFLGIVAGIIYYAANRKPDPNPEPKWEVDGKSTAPAEATNKEKIDEKIRRYNNNADAFDKLADEWDKRGK